MKITTKMAVGIPQASASHRVTGSFLPVLAPGGGLGDLVTW